MRGIGFSRRSAFLGIDFQEHAEGGTLLTFTVLFAFASRSKTVLLAFFFARIATQEFSFLQCAS